MRPLLIAVCVLACDSDAEDPPEVPDAAPRDASVPDAEPPPACEPMLTAGQLSLERCDGRTFTLRRAGRPLLEGGRAGLTIAGRQLETANYPEIAWRVVSATAVEALHLDEGRLPDLKLTLRLSAGSLRVELRISGADAVPIDSVHPLLARVTGPDAGGAELDLPEMYIASAAPDGGSLAVEVSAGALTTRTVGPTASLLGPYDAAPLQILVGDSPLALRRAQASSMEVAVGGAPPALVWGARLPDGADPVTAASLLRGWASARGLRAPPVVLVPRRRDLAQVAESIAPAALGVRFEAESAAIPSRRDETARDLAALVDVGASFLELSFREEGTSAALRAAYGAARDATPGARLLAPARGRALLGLVDAAGFDTATPAQALASWWHYGERLVGLDLGAVSVASRPAAEVRQAVALRALSGGPYLLADDPAALSDAEVAAWLAPLEAGLVAPAAPGDDEVPPARWQSRAAAAWFNWGDEARTFPGPGGAPIEVPAHDVVLLPVVAE